MNKIFLIGNLTRDPEMRSTTTGVPVCNFSIAVNRRFRDANGQQQTDFINIVAWRQLAELCGKYLTKGRKVAIEGSLQIRSYDAQDGTKRTSAEVVADNVEFLTPAGASVSSAYAQSAAVTPAAPAPRPVPTAPVEGGFTATTVEDDELPF